MSLSSPRFTGHPHLPYQGHGRIPSRITLSRKLRTRLATFKSLLEPQVRATSQVRHNLLSRQQRQKAFYDDRTRGTGSLSTLREGESVRMRRGRECKLAVVVPQHQARHQYIVATPDSTQMRQNHSYPSQLHPTKEEAPPVTSQAWEEARCIHSHYAIINHGHLYHLSSYPSSESTCQKEPTSTRRAPERLIVTDQAFLSQI